MQLYHALKDSASGHPLPAPKAEIPWGYCTDLNFQDRVDSIPIVLQEPEIEHRSGQGQMIREHAAFGIRQDYYDMVIHRQYNFLLEREHAHDYVEVYYVFAGSCRVFFSGRAVQLNTGDMIFIAPSAVHRLESFDKENFILDLSVRGTSFESLFLKQLSYDSLLSAFFRRIIYDKASLNYILFHTHGSPVIKEALKNITMESAIKDTYNEIVCTSWTNIIFSVLLRKYYEDVETDPPLENNDFTRLLAYITDHYDTVTLDELAAQFNYSKSHICNLIKSNTGRTLTALVNAQKLTKAETLLETTDYSIEEITEMIGFTSSDYFTRLFHRNYGVTPGKFRRIRQTNSMNP